MPRRNRLSCPFVPCLEGRVLLAARAPKDDAFEDNDSVGTRSQLGVLADSVRTYAGKLYDADWFGFQTLSVGTANDFVQVKFRNSKGNVDVQLTTTLGTVIRSSTTTTDVELISLQGLAAGSYAIRIFGVDGAVNPSYSLTIDSPAHPPLPSDDTLDSGTGNDTRSTASVLTGTDPVSVTNLVNNDDDWFSFQTTAKGTAANLVQIGFDHSRGDLTLGLYNSRGRLLKESKTLANFEAIAMTGMAAGTYYVRVSKAGDQYNSSYDLSITPPNGVDGEHTLYVNFDGASMTFQNLETWNQGQWTSNWDGTINTDEIYDSIDPARNGINVNAWYGSASNRESNIAAILDLLQADLAPFGIQVVRHFGLAVENVFATTIFVGRSSHDLHIAASIDAGNHDRTDIAFVTHESWETDARLVLATADVILHEAGHTFGLYHVNTGNDAETMGMRYSIPDFDLWPQDTGFLDKFYDRKAGHGPPGQQNSFQYMLSTFGGASASNPVAAGSVFDLATIRSGVTEEEFQLVS